MKKNFQGFIFLISGRENKLVAKFVRPPSPPKKNKQTTTTTNTITYYKGPDVSETVLMSHKIIGGFFQRERCMRTYREVLISSDIYPNTNLYPIISFRLTACLSYFNSSLDEELLNASASLDTEK